ncbi:glutathione peroxidase-like protein [Ascodesmis nigricans]|uniref:Glutathione peroxidase n=1 Tax=Ascodesmis nigricans TaxID=341454 RepID=A0A4S2MY42_9PEZI|nr:glutathione peroxidase-like protein [Ascodesmis nigricans]
MNTLRRIALSAPSSSLTTRCFVPARSTAIRLIPFAAAMSTIAPDTTIYDFKPLDNKGEPVPMSSYKGKVLLIVNVASKCGFTPQYEGLEKIYEKYKDQGFEVLGFPCNQFGGQEPGSAEEIQNFCTVNFGVKFPIMQKVEVNGDKADPLWEYMKTTKPGLLGMKRVKWNYEKFLINREGQIVERYASTTKPESIATAIERELGKEAKL